MTNIHAQLRVESISTVLPAHWGAWSIVARQPPSHIGENNPPARWASTISPIKATNLFLFRRDELRRCLVPVPATTELDRFGLVHAPHRTGGHSAQLTAMQGPCFRGTAVAPAAASRQFIPFSTRIEGGVCRRGPGIHEAKHPRAFLDGVARGGVTPISLRSPC